MKKNIIVIMLMFFAIIVNAKNNPPNIKHFDANSSPSLTNLIEGNEVLIKDDDGFYGLGTYRNRNQNTYIRFGIDGLPIEEYLNGFNVSIEFTIQPLLTNGTFGRVSTKKATIEYNPNLLGNNIEDLEVFKLENTRGARVQVKDFYFNYNGTKYYFDPGNVFFELEYRTERYCLLDDNITYNQTIESINSEIKFSWDEIECAEEYELEWTWIDDYNDTSIDDTFNHPFTIRDFELNNTRIRLDANQLEYTIPNTFSKGNILFRIRAIGRFLENPSKFYYGPWSVQSHNSVNEWNPITERLTIGTHEANKNWQFQSSFAENGKRKDVISYFDGTLRNRQTVTKINTNNNIVVGEVIYDNQGRPAIEVLPTPIYTDSYFKFYDDLNTNDATEIFTHKDFDWDDPTTSQCGSIANLMSSNSGASRYYSSNGTMDSSTNFQKFVPDAEGYPYSQIEYTSDNTGRISKKSGVGLNHQIGSGHEMIYLYDTPYQLELNRLFGYNVGNFKHYKKNLVIDPNKQTSVSYIDPQGRTIATALLGDTPKLPDNTTNRLIPLDDEQNTSLHKILSFNILNNTRYSEGENNGLRTFKNISVGYDADYTFNYTLNVTPNFFNTTYTSCNMDFDFVYDLSISLNNNCADEILTNAPSETITTLSDGTIASLPYTETKLLSKGGTYTLVKDLKVNKEALNNYANQYIEALTDPDNASCYIDPSDFAPEADFSTCAITCDQCVQDLIDLYTNPNDANLNLEQAKLNYLDVHTIAANNFSLHFDTDGDGSPDFISIENFNTLDDEIKAIYTDRFNREFDLLVNSCTAPCESNDLFSSCVVSNRFLLQDMSPNGQYGNIEFVDFQKEDEKGDPLYDGDGNPIIVSKITDLASIFNEDNLLIYYDDNGDLQNISWRNGEYKDEDGFDSKILLTIMEDESTGTVTYSPEIIEDAIVHNDSNGIWVAPQDLKDIKDFLIRWQPSWANALIIFHPEYKYTFYQNSLCTTKSDITFLDGTTKTYSSEQYDKFLDNIKTFQEASDLGLIDSNDNMAISLKDPYFINQFVDDDHSSDFLEDLTTYDLRKGIVKYALTAQYEDSGDDDGNTPLNMLEVAYQTVICNGISTCDFSGNIYTLIAELPSDAQRNKVWETYKAYYLSLKQKIQYTFISNYAAKLGVFNIYIGVVDPNIEVDTFANILYADVLGKSKINSNDFAKDQIDEMVVLLNPLDQGLIPHFRTLTPFATYLIYGNKSKRFINADITYDTSGDINDAINELEDTSEYETWLQTGACPLAFDLELFLSGMTAEKDNNDNYLSLIYHRNYTSQYITPDLYQRYTGNTQSQVQPFDIIPTIGNNSTINIALSTTTDTLVSITIDNLDWNDYNTLAEEDSRGWYIRSISDLRYMDYIATNTPYTFNYEALAWIFNADATPQLQQIRVYGATPLPIGECGTSTTVDDTLVEVVDVLDPSTSNEVIIPPDITLEEKANLVKNLLNHLRWLAERGISIPDGYNPPEMQALSPYILSAQESNEIPGVYNFKVSVDTYVFFNGGDIQHVYDLAFSFTPNPSEYYLLDDSISYRCADGLSITFSGWGDTIQPPDEFDVYIHEYDCTIEGFDITNGFSRTNECNNIDLVFSKDIFNIYAASWEDGMSGGDCYNNSEDSGGNPKTILLRNIDLKDELKTPEATCIPPIPEVVSCTDKYQEFISNLDFVDNGNGQYFSTVITGYKLPNYLKPGLDMIDSVGNVVYQIDPATGEQRLDNYHNPIPVTTGANGIDDAIDYFCGMNIGYLVDSYLYYITELNITDTNNPYFIEIEEFGNTHFNYGYNDINTIIDAFVAKTVPYTGTPIDTDTIQTWREYANWYLEESNACPPVPMFPEFQPFIPTQDYSDCEEFVIEVAEAYSLDAYNAYLASLKAKFKQDYIEQALSNVSESLTEKHADKEYQYTLYYYDQAGNLIQTVPPEGVDRKDNIDNDAVNSYRINPTGTAPAIPNHRLKTKYKYNSLNQLVWQKTPDGGETVFAYDKLGRIIASQNDKQKSLSYNEDLPQAYSYTLYDGLGRITEAGQVFFKPDWIVNGSINENINEAVNNGIRTEVSKTKYDELNNSYIEGKFEQYSHNSRGRVVEVKYYDELPNGKYNNAIYYDYDIHGNVKQILREINDDRFLKDNKQHIKSTIYEYDLISGNVNKVYFQKHKIDQFIHKYQYDADNRITNVQTSKDGVIWEKDATYNYYDHGPLARTVLGEHQVQGLDYAYTLQGWLKSVNGDRLNPANDMGNDGSLVAKDAFAYALHYYQGDYSARAGNTNSFLTINTDSNQFNLYNGNIKSMVTAILDHKSNPLTTANNSYRYDQLNRIKSMTSTEVHQLGVTTTSISSNYSYDRNGNLKTLNRWAKDKTRTIRNMDRLSYSYNKDTNDNIVNNQLQLVHDALVVVDDQTIQNTETNMSRFSSDINDQQKQLKDAGIIYNPTSTINPDGTINETARATHNYQYDKIGQLVADLTEGLARIEWTVSGKVKRIFKIDPNYLIANKASVDVDIDKYINGDLAALDLDKAQSIITFEYDALGNRLSKKVNNLNSKYKYEANTTYYIRDAQGNVLSIYNKKELDKSVSYILKEQNIYGSSRVGLQQSDLGLVYSAPRIISPFIKKSSTKKLEPKIDRAMHFDANYEATINDTHAFSFKGKESINIGANLEIIKPETNGSYNIVKFESQDQDSIVKLHQLKLNVLFDGEQYKPQLILRTFKDSTNIKNVTFTFEKYLKSNNLDVNFDVQILDSQNDKYDVILSLGKETYVVGKGLNQTVNYEPYTTSHSTPINKIASNLENPLDFNLDNFYYGINGVQRVFNFEKGYGNPVSSDGQRTLQTSSGNWLTRGVITNDYQRIIGDKRYELSNHLGNVLSVISDHKAISTDTGNLSHSVSFYEGTDIAPWYAHPLTNSIETIENRGLEVVSSHNLNGIGATYTLDAYKIYSFSFYYENRSKFPLEFGISYGGNSMLKKYIKPFSEGYFEVEFKTKKAGVYTLNLNIRAKGLDPKKELKKQIFYIKKFEINDITNRNDALIAENIIFVPEVLSYNDYYPFGMTVPTRHFSSNRYRYGFQGQEKDDEIKGEGNSINYKFRMHDPRVGRFFAVDPLTDKYPWNSPYAFSENRVVDSFELEGLESMYGAFRNLPPGQADAAAHAMAHPFGTWDGDYVFDVTTSYPIGPGLAFTAGTSKIFNFRGDKEAAGELPHVGFTVTKNMNFSYDAIDLLHASDNESLGKVKGLNHKVKNYSGFFVGLTIRVDGVGGNVSSWVNDKGNRVTSKTGTISFVDLGIVIVSENHNADVGVNVDFFIDPTSTLSPYEQFTAEKGKFMKGLADTTSPYVRAVFNEILQGIDYMGGKLKEQEIQPTPIEFGTPKEPENTPCEVCPSEPVDTYDGPVFENADDR